MNRSLELHVYVALKVVFCLHSLSLVHSLLPTFVPNCCDFSTRISGVLQATNDDDSMEEYVNGVDKMFNEIIRYRGRVAYDGSGFRGWQVQAKGRTIQVSKQFHILVKPFFLPLPHFEHVISCPGRTRNCVIDKIQ
jgi:hypothetical protein